MSFSKSVKDVSKASAVSALVQQSADLGPDQRDAFQAGVRAAQGLLDVVGSGQHNVTVNISGHINEDGTGHVSLQVNSTSIPDENTKLKPHEVPGSHAFDAGLLPEPEPEDELAVESETEPEPEATTSAEGGEDEDFQAAQV